MLAVAVGVEAGEIADVVHVDGRELWRVGIQRCLGRHQMYIAAAWDVFGFKNDRRQVIQAHDRANCLRRR